MALLHKDNERMLIFAVMAAIAAGAVYLFRKGGPAAAAYQAAIDGTANTIADVIGLTDRETALNEPAPVKHSPEYNALIAASDAYHYGYMVDEATWRMALDYNKTNPVMLRAGRLWGYGSFLDYWGKDF